MVASNEYLEYILSTFGLAAEANRRTPGRKGCVIWLTPESADEVFVTGDLHGHQTNLSLIRQAAALEEHPRRHLVLQEVCHGGPSYVQNGGCRSHAVLEEVAWLKTQFPGRVHFILGNHELSEMTDYPIQKNRQLLNLAFWLGLQQMYGPAAEQVREAALNFLRSCPLAVRLPHGVFISHSLPSRLENRPFDPSIFSRELGDEDFSDQGDVFRLVWGRDYREKNAKVFAELVDSRVFINGHEPCGDGFYAPNDLQLVLDCCGEPAGYVILPVGEELSHAEIVARARHLGVRVG